MTRLTRLTRRHIGSWAWQPLPGCSACRKPRRIRTGTAIWPQMRSRSSILTRGTPQKLVLHATNEEIMGKLIASKGKGYDVVFVSSPFAEILHNLGSDRELDHSKLPEYRQPLQAGDRIAARSGQRVSRCPIPGARQAYATAAIWLTARQTAGWTCSSLQKTHRQDHHVATDRWMMAAGELALGYSVNETDQAKLENVRDLLIGTKKTLLA